MILKNSYPFAWYLNALISETYLALKPVYPILDVFVCFFLWKLTNPLHHVYYIVLQRFIFMSNELTLPPLTQPRAVPYVSDGGVDRGKHSPGRAACQWALASASLSASIFNQWPLLSSTLASSPLILQTNGLYYLFLVFVLAVLLLG